MVARRVGKHVERAGIVASPQAVWIIAHEEKKIPMVEVELEIASVSIEGVDPDRQPGLGSDRAVLSQARRVSVHILVDGEHS